VTAWLLLVYKVPSEPTARRVYVWRKLKRLGALLLHDSVWVLPATPYIREQLQWLAAEITEMAGEALLWDAHTLSPQQDEHLIQQFSDEADSAYTEILGALEQDGADVAVLSRRYQQVRLMDYFGSKIGQRVKEALISRGEEHES
jgi:DNA-binding transcriptional regulator PaaX